MASYHTIVLFQYAVPFKNNNKIVKAGGKKGGGGEITFKYLRDS